MLFAIGYAFCGFLTAVYLRGCDVFTTKPTDPLIVFMVVVVWPGIVFYLLAEGLGERVARRRARRTRARDEAREARINDKLDEVVDEARREANVTSEVTAEVDVRPATAREAREAHQDNVAALNAKLRKREDRERMPV